MFMYHQHTPVLGEKKLVLGLGNPNKPHPDKKCHISFMFYKSSYLYFDAATATHYMYAHVSKPCLWYTTGMYVCSGLKCYCIPFAYNA